jgi:hypothetical protein
VAIPGARGCWRTVLLSAAFAAPACVSVVTEPEETMPSAMPVVVPFGPNQGSLTSDEQVMADLYRGLLRRMGAAYADGDLHELQKLIAGYRRDETPEWARASMDSFAGLAEGLAFEQHCKEHGSIALADPNVALGEGLLLRVRIEAPSGSGWQLGGGASEHPVSFGVWYSVVDEFVEGSTSNRDRNETMRLSQPVALRPGQPFDLPIELDLDVGAAVRRTIRIRLALLPGYVTAGELRAPVRRTEFGKLDLVQYPRGYEPIRDNPRDTLKGAMKCGDEAHFRHVWLAAHFAKEADREVVLEDLMQWVRLGTAGQQRVAMASLRAVLGSGPAIGDREAWLAWWQGRR